MAPATPPEAPLGRRAAKASALALVGFGAAQLVRFASNIVLAFLLPPAAFGLMQLANVLVKGMNLFSDAGLASSVVRSDRGDDPAFVRTAWTLQVIRGVIIFGLVALLAGPYAAFYDDPRLVGLGVIVGGAAVFKGVRSPALLGLRRHLRVGRTVTIGLAGSLSTTVLIVLFALWRRDVYALAIGTLAGAAAATLWGYVLTRSRPPRPGIEWAALREQTGFGKWILLTTALTFLATQGDKLLLGKLIPIETLGLYAIALTLASVPREVMHKLSSQVFFPAISKRKNLPREELRRRLSRKTLGPMLLMAPALAAAAVWGDLAIVAIYPVEFAAAGWMFSILAAGMILRWVVMLTGPALMALGRPQYNAFGSAGRIVFVAAGLFPAVHLAGPLGAVIVVATADIPNYISNLIGAWRHGLLDLRRDLAIFGVFVLTAGVMLGARWAAGIGLPAFGAL